MTPTTRTKQYFVDHGYTVDIVERWIGVGLPNQDPKTGKSFIGSRKKRKDWCWFADLIAYDQYEVIAVQSTSTNTSARVNKILTDPKGVGVTENAIKWLLGECSGCGRSNRKILVQGWVKYKKPVDRKYWRPKDIWMTLEDFQSFQVAQVKKNLQDQEKLHFDGRNQVSTGM